MGKNKWTIQDIPDLSGRVVIVTGGNVGLGLESAKAFAGQNATLILGCRNIQKGEGAKQQILREYPKSKVEVIQLDLADLSSIRSFVTKFNANYSQLDILLNNAGIMNTPYGLTKDGFEQQMGTNHLGHFALTGLLLPMITKTKGSRVVMVSSNAHKLGDMDFDDLLFEGGNDYSGMKAYGRSKLSNLLFAYELQRYFEKHGIESISVAAHPGGSRTNLYHYFQKNLLTKVFVPLYLITTQSAAQGALPQVRAAVDPEVKGGQYYGPDGFMEFKGDPVLTESNDKSRSLEDAQDLWQISEELTGIKYGV